MDWYYISLHFFPLIFLGCICFLYPLLFYISFFMGRERRITIYVSSNSIVIEMIKKDTLSENRVIWKIPLKFKSFLFISIFFFCLQKHFALLIYQFQKKKKKKKRRRLCSHVCILLNVMKINIFWSWKNDENDTYSCMLKLIKSVYKTFSNR